MGNASMFLFNDDEEMKPKPSEIKRLQEGSVKCIEKKERTICRSNDFRITNG